MSYICLAIYYQYKQAAAMLGAEVVPSISGVSVFMSRDVAGQASPPGGYGDILTLD